MCKPPISEPADVLEIRNLHSHYGLSHVLQGVDLTLGKGECVGLFGRNGVGKTTIVRAIAGWIKQMTGTIRYDGRNIAGLEPNAICKLGIGFVPEDRRIFPGLTVEENLKLGLLQTIGRSRADKAAAIERVYELFPRLRQRHRQMGTTLSGGEQQMLAIGRVLVGDQKLLLIDEPTEGLAPQIVDEIFAIMRTLKAEGHAILLVEQNVRRAFSLTDRICAVERGRVIFEGSGASEADRDALMKAIAV
jgi:branched-chain amino acid transport system ATP-binding protein